MVGRCMSNFDVFMWLNSSVIFWVYKTSVCVPCLWCCSGCVLRRSSKLFWASCLCCWIFQHSPGRTGRASGASFPSAEMNVKGWCYKGVALTLFASFLFCVHYNHSPHPNLQCSCIIGLEHGLTWPYRQYELRTLDTINIVVFPPFASLRLWLNFFFNDGMGNARWNYF